ncbi:hypothetical protein PG989_010381 [Apiospora arundinis]
MSADAQMPVFPPPRNPNDLGRGPMLMGLTWTFTGLAVLTTLLRFYVRKRIGPHFAVDDWLMAAAAAFQLAAQILVSMSFKYGMGKHQYDLVIPDEIVPMGKLQWLSVLPGLTAGMLGRISICILLVRLFGINRWFKHYAIILTAAGVVVNIVIMVILYASRTPVESLWNPFIPGAKSWDPRIVQDFMFVGQGLYALADLTFVLIPIVFIWKLQMSLDRRLGLIAIMAMGLFTCAMSIMKGVSAIPGASGDDAAYVATLSLLWATLEQACVVLLGNVPPLRPLARIDIPFVSHLTGTVASLLRRTRNTTRGSTSKTMPGSGVSSGYHPNNGYEDLEMNTNKLGAVNTDAWHEVHGGSPENSIKHGCVQRTDQFSVSYDAIGRKGSK